MNSKVTIARLVHRIWFDGIKKAKKVFEPNKGYLFTPRVFSVHIYTKK